MEIDRYLTLEVSPQKVVTSRHIWRSCSQPNIHILWMMHKDLNFRLLKVVLVQGLKYFQIFFWEFYWILGGGELSTCISITIAYQACFHFFLLNEVKSLLTFAELSAYDCFLWGHRRSRGYVNCTRTNAELEQNIWEETAAVLIEIVWYVMRIWVPQYKNAYTYMEKVALLVLFLKIYCCIKCFVKNNSKCVFVVIFISKLLGYCATLSVNLNSVCDIFQFQTAEELGVHGQLSRSAGGNAWYCTEQRSEDTGDGGFSTSWWFWDLASGIEEMYWSWKVIDCTF